MERFSDGAERVVEVAEAEARRLEHPHIGTEHLLLGLIVVDSPARHVLLSAGATADAARSKVDEAVGQHPSPPPRERQLSPRARSALDRASRLSLNWRDPHVEPEHLLIAVLDVEGRAGQVLRGLGVDVAALRQTIDLPLGASVHHEAAPAGEVESKWPAPHCPVCGAGLQPGLVFRHITAEDEHGHRLDFVVSSCSACGAAVGATPA